MANADKIMLGNGTVVGTVEVPLKVTAQDISNLLDNCFASYEGSMHWIEAIQKVDNPGDWYYLGDIVAGGGKLILVDNNDETAHELTIEVVLKGIKKYVESGRVFDLDIMDSGDSDCVLQYAIFDELVFS